jgi:hypothetical protein
MRFIKSRRTKFVAAVVGVIAMTVAASRQLYLHLLNANGSPGAQGSRYHLWLALGALSMTCVASALTFFFFLGPEDGGGGLRDA